MPIPIEQTDIDAFSSWVSSVPVIGLCTAKNCGDRQRWSAGHELGHLVMHFGKIIRGDEHKQADVFAGELLLPKTAMLREIVPPVTLSSLAALKPRWGVSIQALIYRAQELGIITDRQYRYLFEQISVRGWRKRVERPRALRKIAEMSPFGDNTARLAAQLALSPDAVNEILNGHDPAPATDNTVTSKVVSLRRSN
jgi:Zn-dependent peptidase ImmA (M78 family)